MIAPDGTKSQSHLTWRVFLGVLFICLLMSLCMLICTGCSANKSNRSEYEKIEADVGTDFGSFETTDLEGNTVTQDVFSGHTLTMVNVWTTWCPYCIQEMPEFDELEEKYADQGFQVVTVCYDAFDENSGDTDQDVISDAKDIIADSGCTRPALIYNQSFNLDLFGNIDCYPTSFFVDENGVIVDEVLGASTLDEWSDTLDYELKKVS